MKPRVFIVQHQRNLQTSQLRRFKFSPKSSETYSPKNYPSHHRTNINNSQSEHDSNRKTFPGKNRQKQQLTKNKLWTPTARSLTRENVPAYRIPQAKRFTSLDVHDKYSFQSSVYSDIKRDNKITKGGSKDVTFAKALRRNLFLERDQHGYPSPATYNKVRYLDNSYYKRDHQAERIKFSARTGRKMSDFITMGDSHLTSSPGRTKREENNSGRTFYKFSNYNKQYVPHAKNIAYQPQLYQANPGAGQYNIASNIAKQKPAYTMRKLLTRFIDQLQYTSGGGPAVYSPEKKTETPSSAKGTFQYSNRTYLRDVGGDKVPGPGEYQIRRYLETHHQQSV